jgi:hypothetical protein
MGRWHILLCIERCRHKQLKKAKMSQRISHASGYKPPDDIIVLALRAISGEITKSMREIAFGYRGKEAKFLFYMDTQPTELERENAEIIAVNFEAGHPETLHKLDIEFVVTNEPLGRFDHLDFIIFRRYE